MQSLVFSALDIETLLRLQPLSRCPVVELGAHQRGHATKRFLEGFLEGFFKGSGVSLEVAYRVLGIQKYALSQSTTPSIKRASQDHPGLRAFEWNNDWLVEP